MRNLNVLLTSACLVCVTTLASADEWPQFRGPSAAGISTETNLPTHWSETKNIHWKTRIDGISWSSPIVWGNRVFLTTAIPEGEQEKLKKGLYFGGNRLEPRDMIYRWEVLCLSRDSGKVLWKTVAKRGKPTSPIHLKNSYAAETPATDGERLFAFFGSEGLFCYDLDGKLLWKQNYGTFKTRYGWGTARSPLLDGDQLFLQCDNEDQSYVTALDKHTGEELWRVQRDEGSSWSTPFIWNNRQRNELITCATNRVRAYDPASGQMLWELGGMSSIAVPTPVATEDLLYVSSGYVMDKKRPLFAIRPGSFGDITVKDGEQSSSGVAWVQRVAGPYMPSPVLYQGLIYVLYDRGLFACFDAETGQAVYDRQRIAGGKSFTASPWAYDGKVFCQSEDGETYVIQAGRQFEKLHVNTIDELFMASPAIAHGSLFLRGVDHIYCIRNAAGEGE